MLNKEQKVKVQIAIGSDAERMIAAMKLTHTFVGGQTETVRPSIPNLVLTVPV